MAFSTTLLVTSRICLIALEGDAFRGPSTASEEPENSPHEDLVLKPWLLTNVL